MSFDLLLLSPLLEHLQGRLLRGEREIGAAVSGALGCYARGANQLRSASIYRSGRVPINYCNQRNVRRGDWPKPGKLHYSQAEVALTESCH